MAIKVSLCSTCNTHDLRKQILVSSSLGSPPDLAGKKRLSSAQSAVLIHMYDISLMGGNLDRLRLQRVRGVLVAKLAHVEERTALCLLQHCTER